MSEEVFITEIKNFNELNEYLVGTKGIIAGGVFKDMLERKKPKDIDIFFKWFDHYEEAVNKYNDNELYTELYENVNATAFINKDTGVVVELISGNFGSPDKIISKFDFTVTKMAYYRVLRKPLDGGEPYWENKVVYHKDFFKDLTFKKLVIDDVLVQPFKTFNRVLRYSRYGYKMDDESKVKLIKIMQKIHFDQHDSFETDFYDF